MDDQGWTMEMAILFKSLRYKKGREQIWSINLRRTVRWKNEDSFLSPVKASHRFHGIYHFSEAATLVGIQAPLSSRNLELKPYAISSVITDVTEDPPVRNDLNGDVGFDLKYGLTKGLIADFTYNTDFAQVEADEQQVNLTRFSLFFPGEALARRASAPERLLPIRFGVSFFKGSSTISPASPRDASRRDVSKASSRSSSLPVTKLPSSTTNNSSFFPKSSRSQTASSSPWAATTSKMYVSSTASGRSVPFPASHPFGQEHSSEEIARRSLITAASRSRRSSRSSRVLP